MTRFAAFALLMLSFAVAPAVADIIDVGEAEEGNSWSQAFRENGRGQFDMLAVRIYDNSGAFESVSLFSFTSGGATAPGWKTVYENDAVFPTLATASGSAVEALTWKIRFQDPKADPITLDYAAFYKGQIVNTAHIERNYSQAKGKYVWTITNYGTAESPFWNPAVADVVPVPGAVVLAGLALPMVAWVRRRMA